MIVIWILAAVGVAQAVFAGRAYMIEKREGLRRSSTRMVASLGIAVALIGLGVVGTLTQGGSAATTGDHAPADAATQAKIDALKTKIASLQAELDTQYKELDKLDPQAVPSAPHVAPTWPLMVAVGLVLLGFFVLTLGDLTTLLPSRRRTPAPPPVAGAEGDVAAAIDEVADLAALVTHAHASRWKQGAAVADRIQLEQLEKLEVLDLLYLRALCNVMIVCAPPPAPGAADATGADKPLTHQERDTKLAAARADLVRLLELAPHMAEAIWLQGYVDARAGKWQLGLDLMRRARPELGALGIPFEHDESVCLLNLAEDRLAQADTDGATKLFDEVSKLGVLANEIPVAVVTHRILAVRAQIKEGKLTEASEAIARMRQVDGLDADAKRATLTACDLYEIAIQYRGGKLDDALATTLAFLKRVEPAKLPPVEDQVADEFLLPAVDVTKLALPAELFRALYFLEAVLRVELASRRGKALEPEAVDAIATALLRALQFQPRHREALAALAALYLAYRKERTTQALAWLDAALALGVRSTKARALLVEAKRAEHERKELLAMFRAASTRFLSDPTIGAQVRAALIEELGRFDEFRPVVLDLQDSGALDLPAVGDVTINGIRERAAFIASVAAEVTGRIDQASAQKLADQHRELASLAANVDSSANRIAALERAVMEQLGQLVLR